MLASRMSDFNKLNVGCRILTGRMSDFNKSDVGFLQLRCSSELRKGSRYILEGVV